MKQLIKTNKNVILNDLVNSEKLANNFVRIQVVSVGLCRTDLFVANGIIPVSQEIVLGHEFSGQVIESKSELFKVGDRVSVNPLFPEKGFMGLDFNGCLQEYIDIPEQQVIHAFDLDYKTAAYLEPVAASMAVLKACHDKNSIGAIYGKNRIAELTYIIMKNEGYNVKWLSEKEEYPDNYYDYVIETLFDEVYLQKIIKMLKPEGLLVIKSRKKQGVPIVSSELVRKELTLKSVNYYDFNQTMQWLIKNQKSVQHLLGQSYSIDNWEEAFKVSNSAESQKIFIHFE